MAKVKKVVADPVLEENTAAELVTTEVEEVVADSVAVFADTLEPEPVISPTVAYAIQQAQDRLIRDKANFPQI